MAAALVGKFHIHLVIYHVSNLFKVIVSSVGLACTLCGPSHISNLAVTPGLREGFLMKVTWVPASVWKSEQIFSVTMQIRICYSFSDCKCEYFLFYKKNLTNTIYEFSTDQCVCACFSLLPFSVLPGYEYKEVCHTSSAACFLSDCSRASLQPRVSLIITIKHKTRQS